MVAAQRTILKSLAGVGAVCEREHCLTTGKTKDRKAIYSGLVSDLHLLTYVSVEAIIDCKSIDYD